MYLIEATHCSKTNDPNLEYPKTQSTFLGISFGFLEKKEIRCNITIINQIAHAMDFIDTQKVLFPDLAEQYENLGNLFEKK
jgi:hypothetical protein